MRRGRITKLDGNHTARQARRLREEIRELTFCLKQLPSELRASKAFAPYHSRLRDLQTTLGNLDTGERGHSDHPTGTRHLKIGMRSPSKVVVTARNKSAFVLSMPLDMPAKEVVQRAKEVGVQLIDKYVYAVRSNARQNARRKIRRAVTDAG